MLQVSYRNGMHFVLAVEIPLSHSLLPVLLFCGRVNNTLTIEMISASALQLIQCMESETDPAGIVSQCKCFFTSLIAIGGPTVLPKELHEPVIQVIKHHLQKLTEERIARAKKPASELVDVVKFEVHIENFALLQMARLALVLDPTNPLGHEVLRVRDMGVGMEESPADGSG
jgi:importin-5